MELACLISFGKLFHNFIPLLKKEFAPSWSLWCSGLISSLFLVLYWWIWELVIIMILKLAYAVELKHFYIKIAQFSSWSCLSLRSFVDLNRGSVCARNSALHMIRIHFFCKNTRGFRVLLYPESQIRLQ